MATKEQARRYREKNRDKINAARRIRRKNDSKFREKQNARVRKWNKEHPGVNAKINARRRKVITQQTMAAYGGTCVCCGETSPLFLTIDHVNGNGTKHRKEVLGDRRAGIHMYRWLQQQGYPKDAFQIMCFNCNLGRQRNGGICPHKDR